MSHVDANMLSRSESGGNVPPVSHRASNALGAAAGFPGCSRRLRVSKELLEGRLLRWAGWCAAASLEAKAVGADWDAEDVGFVSDGAGGHIEDSTFGIAAACRAQLH